MKTWNQFLEAKAKLAPMGEQPPTAGTGGLNIQKQIPGLPPGWKVGQTAPPVQAEPTPEEKAAGEAYAKSMKIQQDMAKAQMRRRG